MVHYHTTDENRLWVFYPSSEYFDVYPVFVDDKTPWCHLDIAGVHVSDKNAGPYIDGPTGWGVRLLANLVND